MNNKIEERIGNLEKEIKIAENQLKKKVDSEKISSYIDKYSSLFSTNNNDNNIVELATMGTLRTILRMIINHKRKSASLLSLTYLLKLLFKVNK
jgi:hypothetical protein